MDELKQLIIFWKAVEGNREHLNPQTVHLIPLTVKYLKELLAKR